VEHFSVFLQKWRAMVEVSFLRYCVDPNAPKEPLDADALAEAQRLMPLMASLMRADGGDDEALVRGPPGRGERRWQRRRLFSRRVLSPLLSGQPGSVEGTRGGPEP
jgi:hypothetical protein